MSVGEDVLLDVRLRSAQSSRAGPGGRGWLGSAPEGAYHRRLGGQTEVGRCASLCLKTSSLIYSPNDRGTQFHYLLHGSWECRKERSPGFRVTGNLITVSDETTIHVRRANALWPDMRNGTASP